MKSDVAVIYLARSADGAALFRRFATSYREYPAEIPHELVVIYKGFSSRKEAEAARQEFAGLPHVGIDLDDFGFDIGSYWKAAQRIAHQHVVFLNTHTTINAAGWLKHLHHHAAEERCGITGAMGSYESLRTTIPYLEAVITASLTPPATRPSSWPDISISCCRGFDRIGTGRNPSGRARDRCSIPSSGFYRAAPTARRSRLLAGRLGPR